MDSLEHIVINELETGISDFNSGQDKFIKDLEKKYPLHAKQIKYSVNNQLQKNLKNLISNPDSIQEAVKLLNKVKFVKSKIPEIANKFIVKHSDMKGILMREMFKKLEKDTDIKNLCEVVFKYFEKETFQKSDGLKFISNNLLKDIKQFMPYLLRDGFDQDFTGLEIGMKSSNEGDGAEHLFVAKAMIAGFNCSVVDIGSSKYDVVIEDKNGGLLKVQIKSFGKDGKFSRRGRDRGGQGIDSSDPSNRGKLVTSSNCDIFVAVNKSNGEIFIFAKDEIDKLPEKDMKRDEYIDNWENWSKINQSIE